MYTWSRSEPRLLGQQAVQQLTGTAHERTALQVLFSSRPLPHDHEVGVGIALPEDHCRPAGGQRAAGTRQGYSFDIGEP